MINQMYAHMLEETSQNLNMTRQHLNADTKRLAEYWEAALEQGCINDIDTAILFLDSSIHSYLKAKGIDLGNKRVLKKDHRTLAKMTLLISMYALNQAEDSFPKIHELTPMSEQQLQRVTGSGSILELAEKIRREKSEGTA